MGSTQLVNYKNRIYLFGGKLGNKQYSNDMFVWDINKEIWNKIIYKQINHIKIPKITYFIAKMAILTTR